MTKEAILMCIFSVITNENFYCYLSVVCIQKLEMASSRRDVYIRETVVILTSEFFIAEKQQFFFCLNA